MATLVFDIKTSKLSRCRSEILMWLLMWREKCGLVDFESDEQTGQIAMGFWRTVSAFAGKLRRDRSDGIQHCRTKGFVLSELTAQVKQPLFQGFSATILPARQT